MERKQESGRNDVSYSSFDDILRTQRFTVYTAIVTGGLVEEEKPGDLTYRQRKWHGTNTNAPSNFLLR